MQGLPPAEGWLDPGPVEVALKCVCGVMLAQGASPVDRIGNEDHALAMALLQGDSAVACMLVEESQPDVQVQGLVES